MIPDHWWRAMERAVADELKPIKVAGTVGPYRVRSVSRPGVLHVVTLNAAGQIVSCSDCPGWHGRQHPCKHAGAVALARLHEQGIPPEKEDDDDEKRRKERVEHGVIDAPTRRNQPWPDEV